MKKRVVLVSAVFLFITTALAVGLRLYRLGAQSLWYDEGFSVYLARMSLSEITARTATDIQPPLYYYLLHGWMQLFGQSEAALRSLSLVFGVLSVPLLYAVAGQLFRSRLAGLLGALLLAASPLHIWYSQEVRMYTLLTFLALLSSYFLLLIVRRTPPHPAAGEKPGVGRDSLLWAGYTLSGIAALYTHYFAFFVLAFQGVYLIWVWGVGGFRPLRLIAGGIISGAVLLFSYLPWLPYLLTRYGADTSYWPGQLKLKEVLVDSAISWVGGESVSQQIGILLAVGTAAVLVVCLLAFLGRPWRRKKGGGADGGSRLWEPEYPLAFLLLYMLLPPALILFLSYDAPKFNARYVMVSQPALLLLLAGGLSVLWQRRARWAGNLVRWTLAGGALAFLLGTAAYADYQIYSAPTFARADFRGAAGYIRTYIQPDETVILCSGHMFPVFDLYAAGQERHLLPDSPTLDTTRTLDYGIAADLNRWLAGKGGVWVLLWQNEVVDPVGYLTTLLDGVGDRQPVGKGFPQLEVRHYRFREHVQLSDKPAIQHPTVVNFADTLELLGYSQTGPQQVTLFWQAMQPLKEDYLVSIVLRDTNNQVWGQWDGRPAAYLYPTDRWRLGQVVFGRYDLVPMPGTPPGDYGLDVGVYTEADPVGLDLLDQAGAAQGKRAMLGAVNLSVPAVSADEIEVANQIKEDAGGGLTLLGWDLSCYEAQPGDRLLLTLVWSVTGQPSGDYGARLVLSDATGQTLDAGAFPPTNHWHPTSTWQPGQAWRGQSTFRVPILAEPGRARLAVLLVDSAGADLGPAVELGAIQIHPTTRSFAAPAPSILRETNFANKIALLGADVAPETVRPGDTLRVTLYWLTQADMDVPYTVFVHLLGPDGLVVAGNDGQPVGNSRPTTGWVPGEFVTDQHSVAIPAHLAPGEYIVEVGLYDAGAAKMPRLPVLGDEGKIETDRVIFGPVEVR